MKTLKRTFLISAIALGLSVVTFAQKQEDKKPPKPPPPVIKPGDKPKENKPKKPNSQEAVWKAEEMV